MDEFAAENPPFTADTGEHCELQNVPSLCPIRLVIKISSVQTCP
jgi:hypothetical protein